MTSLRQSALCLREATSASVKGVATCPFIPLHPTIVGIERQTSLIPYSPLSIEEIVRTESVE